MVNGYVKTSKTEGAGDMTTTRKKHEHPADAFGRAQIAEAVYFTAHFRKGPHEKYTEKAETLADARAIATKLDTMHGEFGRRSVVYAVIASGRFYVVPDNYPS